MITKLLLNDGAGGFPTSVDLTPIVGGPVFRHYLADVHGDQRADLIVQKNGSGAASNPSVELWLNNYPAWTLVWSTTPALPPNADYLAFGTADFNGDGLLDLVSQFVDLGCSPWCTQAWVYLGTGSGFTSVPQVIDMAGGELRRIHDMDQDGYADLLLLRASAVEQRFLVAYGQPAQTLQAPVSSIVLPTPGPLVIGALPGDIDADGNVDIVVKSQAFDPQLPLQQNPVQHVGIVRGIGPRTYSTTVWDLLSSPSPNSYNPAIADFDLDGDLDLVGLLEYSNLYVFRNNVRFGTGCQGNGNVVPLIGTGSPTIGNPFFGVWVGNALPNATAVMGVATAKTPMAGCGVGLDLANLVLPIGNIGVVTTSLQGDAGISIPLPNDPGLLNLQVFVQWAVLDQSSSFILGGAPLALSQTRTIILRN